MTELRSRSQGNHPVEEVSSLANLYGLEERLLFNKRVIDVSPLEALAQLSWLERYNTPIEETTALENLLQLTWLDLWGTYGGMQANQAHPRPCLDPDVLDSTEQGYICTIFLQEGLHHCTCPV